MENISVFQVGNYIQYPCQGINNGGIDMIVDRILSIDDVQATTEKGLTIQKSLASSQFYPLPIEPEWLRDMGFEQQCKDGIFSLWVISTQTTEYKSIPIIIVEHNENKEFYLSPVNVLIYAHSLQNLFYNITGVKLNLPINI